MIGYIVVAVLVLAALAYISAPLRGRATVEVRPGRSRADEATERKTVALGGIIDLEDEYEAGKLTEADFHRLRADYEMDALEALKELDAMRERTSFDDDLEREIAEARARLFCPTCGERIAPGRACERCAS